MEEIIRHRRPSTLTMREESHSISKLPKQKIRIVHIFEPEIIKTDASNFRELVQRLTGKPAKRVGNKKTRQVSREKLEEEKDFSKCSLIFHENQEARTYNLGGLGDVDGFFQVFSDYPMLPLSSSSHMDLMIGEEQVI